MEAPLPASLRSLAAAWSVAAIAAVSTPLVADEAYYLAWSRALASGYFDHPPGIAWWIAVTGGHPRLAGLVAVPLGLWALVAAARRWGVERPHAVATVVAWTPLALGAMVIATPDTPAFVAWCGAIWAVAARRPIVAGAAFALCLWSKSTAVIALPGLLWALGRGAPRALLTSVLLYAPHVAWSAAHEWLPWSFQAGREWHGFRLHEWIGGQLLVVTPAWTVLAVVALWRGRRGDTAERQLVALSVPVFAVWALMACVTRVDAHWSAFAWPPAAILAVRRFGAGPRWVRGQAVAMTVVGAIVWLGIAHLTPPWRKPLRDGSALRACHGDRAVSGRYQEKALMDLAGPPVPYLAAIGHRSSQYDLWATAGAPTCDFVYLGRPDELGDRCEGVMRPDRACGRDVTRCACRNEKPPPSEARRGLGAKGGSRTLTPKKGTGT